MPVTVTADHQLVVGTPNPADWTPPPATQAWQRQLDDTVRVTDTHSESKSSTSAPVDGPDLEGASLRFSPPVLVNPVTWTPTSTSKSRTFASDQDVIISTPNVIDWSGGVHVTGGRNIVWRGAEFNYPRLFASTTDTADGGADVLNRCIRFTGAKDATVGDREIFLEGVAMRGGYIYEGINLDSANELNITLTIQNVYCEGIQWRTPPGATSGHDGGDLFQPWNGPKRLRIDRVTGDGLTYQGFWLQPTEFGSTVPLGYEFSRINLTGVQGSAVSPASNAQLLAQDSSLPASADRHCEDVWVTPGPGRTWTQSLKGTWEGVSQGPRPAGPFVRPDEVGVGYVSPGYLPSTDEQAALVARSRAEPYLIPEGETGFEHVGVERLAVELTPYTSGFTVTGSEPRDAEGWINLSNLDISGGRLSIASGVSKVRISRFRVRYSGDRKIETVGSNANIVLEDFELDGLSGQGGIGVNGSGMTLRRGHIHHCVDAIRSSWNCHLDTVLICDHTENTAQDHNDSLQTTSSNGTDPASTSNNTCRRTSFVGINAGGATQNNAAVILKPDTGGVQNWLFEDCFFSGGNYTVYLGNPQTSRPIRNIRFINCLWDNRYKYGHVQGPYDAEIEKTVITEWRGNAVLGGGDFLWQGITGSTTWTKRRSEAELESTLNANSAPPPGTGTRDSKVQPFHYLSPWNLPIAGDATFLAADDPITLSLLEEQPEKGHNGVWVNQSSNGHPISLSSASDPVVYAADRSDSTRSGNFYAPASARVSNEFSTGYHDRHGHVLQPNGRYIAENFGVQRSSDLAWSVGRHHLVDLHGNGMGPANGVRAYGGSAIGGLIRTEDIEAGVIRHPIAIAIRDGQLFNMASPDGSYGYYTSGTFTEANAPTGWPAGTPRKGFSMARGYVWPATEQDYDAPSAGHYDGLVPMGTYVAIPPGVDVDTVFTTDAGRMLGHALQDYGGYVTDRSDDLVVYVENTAPSWFADQLLGAPNLNAWEMRRVQRNLRVVSSNGPATPNGGGWGSPRRAAIAADLGAAPTEARPVANEVNLLSADLAGMEGTDLTVFSNHGSGSTRSFDTTWRKYGTQSLRVTADAGASAQAGVMFADPACTVISGRQYRIGAAIRRGSGTTPLQFGVKWRNPDGTQRSEQLAVTVTTTASGVTLASVTLTAPAGGLVYPLVRWTSAPTTGEFYMVDAVSVVAL